MKKRFTEQQIVAILKEGEAGVPSKEICHKQTLQSWGFVSESSASFIFPKKFQKGSL